jgi:hypothetical protein
MHALPADVTQNPTFRLVPLKGARAVGEGRLVMLAPATARAPLSGTRRNVAFWITSAGMVCMTILSSSIRRMPSLRRMRMIA